MESRSFDRIAQSLSETRTRRGTLRLLTGALFGVAAPVALAQDSGAKKKGKGKGKGKNKGPKYRDMCPYSRPAPYAPRCGGLPGEDCTCNLAVEGHNVCISFIETCSGWKPCNSTADCRKRAGFHFVCQAAGSGSCGQVCLPTCDAADAAPLAQGKSGRRGKNANAR